MILKTETEIRSIYYIIFKIYYPTGLQFDLDLLGFYSTNAL